MSNLFIIGNGFDLDHKLKTSYNHFHSFLKSEFPDSTDEVCYIVPEPTIYPDGDIRYDENYVVSFIRYVISCVEGSENWSDLENSLSSISFDDFFIYNSNEFFEDDDFFKKAYVNYGIGKNILLSMKQIQSLFEDWISTIEIHNVKPKLDFEKLITKDSMFLSFNYTNTLEDVYKVKNVCHIHGKQGEDIYFGHGCNKNGYSEIIGTEDSLNNLFNILKKDTSKALRSNLGFFNSLKSSIKNIYSYGFSFNDVDLIYIEKICSILNTKNITWFFKYVEKEKDYEKKIKIFEEKIKSCGFKGRFDLFSVSKEE